MTKHVETCECRRCQAAKELAARYAAGEAKRAADLAEKLRLEAAGLLGPAGFADNAYERARQDDLAMCRSLGMWHRG